MKWFKQIKDVTDAPLIIVGNKADIEYHDVSEEDLNELGEKC